MKDSANQNQNKGFAFFEYINEKATDKAITGLNNLEIHDKRLKV